MGCMGSTPATIKKKMAEEKKKKIKSKFTAEEEFVKEAERVFTSLKDREPFSLGVDLRYESLSVDIHWRITPPKGRDFTASEVEFMLSVLVSRQTPNVTETQLSLYDNELVKFHLKCGS